MLTLYQAEWCPHSHRVRQRLTELGLDFMARQVPAEPEERDELRDAAGTDEIPTLISEDGTALTGEDDILEHLDRRYRERPDAEQHREKAREEVPTFQELQA
jgi:glutathione S-transferase